MMYYNSSALLQPSFDYVNGDDVDEFKAIKKATKKDVDWTSKYLTSDHHDDRATQNIEHYQVVTGQKYPEFATLALPASTHRSMYIDDDHFSTEGAYNRLALPANSLSLSLSPPGKGGMQHLVTGGLHSPSSSSSLQLQAARRPSFSSSGSVKATTLTVTSVAGRSREVSPFNSYASSSYRPRSHTFTVPQGQHGQGHGSSQSQGHGHGSSQNQGQGHSSGGRLQSQAAFYRTTSLPADDLVTSSDRQNTRHLPLSDARRKLRDVLRKSRQEN